MRPYPLDPDYALLEVNRCNQTIVVSLDVVERRGVTPDTAMRLARYFGGDARSWLNLQTAHDLRMAEIEYANEIDRAIRPRRSA